MRCSCHLPWNQTGRGSRSPTCLAAEVGLLHIWVDALKEAGIDSTGINDWFLIGFPDLFRLPGDEDYRATRGDFGCNCYDCLNASQDPTEAPDVVAPPPDIKPRSALNMIKPLARSVGSALSYII